MSESAVQRKEAPHADRARVPIGIAGFDDVLQGGLPAGHLYLLVHVQPHRYFQRQGNELLVELPVNVAQ